MNKPSDQDPAESTPTPGDAYHFTPRVRPAERSAGGTNVPRSNADTLHAILPTSLPPRPVGAAAPRPSSVPMPPPAAVRPPLDGYSTQSSSTNHTPREERLACSFPGLLKILIPERSFIPIAVAVRVVNLSTSGAMIEVHDRAKIQEDIALPNRFFELKVAHPEVPLLRGSIAWSDMSRQNPLLGLACFEKRPELSQLLLNSETLVNVAGPPPLPQPQLDPFPPIIHEETIVLSGTAPEGLEIILKRDDDRRFTAKVVKERFEVAVELEPDIENHFSLRSIAGARKSRPIPVRIACEKRDRKQRFVFQAGLAQGKDGEHIIKLEFTGNVRQSERILYRFSQIMAMSERIELSSTLTSPTGFDRRLFEALRSEGAVLAADTSRNEAASKLLDELL